MTADPFAPPPLGACYEFDGVELLFAVRLEEIIRDDARWCAALADVKRLLGRHVHQRSTPEHTIETIVWVYGGPTRNQGCAPTPGDLVIFRETMKHLRMKYPELLPPGQRGPAPRAHRREP
jgi:hypothetical protein